MQLARSLLFTTFLFMTVPFYATALVLSAPLPYRWRYAIARAWVRAVLGALALLCGLRYTVEGRENIPDEPCVVMLKHSSALETLVELLVFPHQTWVLKRELMWAPFFGWAIALLKPIAVHRGGGRSAVNQLIKRGTERLREGIWVMIFPEGTRVAPGETGRFGVGGAALALRAGTRIVPVAHNAGDYWPRRGWVKYPGTVRFVIGEPVIPGEREPRVINEEIRTWMQATVDAIRRDAGALTDASDVEV